ncbi:MAG: hypothetical protein DRG30_07205, partial [Epsilonproteobacteria bacterium]
MAERSSLEGDVENIADLLWLSQYTGISTPKETQTAHKPKKENRPPESQDNSQQQKQSTPIANKEALELHTKQHNCTGKSAKRPAIPIKSPQKLALSHYREWERIFKFINLEKESLNQEELDEERTIEQIATSGIYDLQFKSTKEKKFSLTLIIDTSESMELWEELIVSFKNMLYTQGVFRQITLYYLDTKEPQAKLYHDNKCKRPTKPKNVVINGRENLLWVLSDCISASWKSGNAFELVELWSRYSLSSIVQMFPKEMWMGTMLYQAKQSRFTTKTLNPLNQKLIIQSRRAKREAKHLKIPVVTFNPYALQSWAKVVTNYPNSSISGVTLSTTSVDHQEKRQSEVTIDDRMNRF